jgi:hypothetical protein
VVAYDGFRRPSEIIIDKIGLWVPIFLTTEAFTRVLARKTSLDIVKVISPVEDFVRVRLMFLLLNSLHNFVEQKVELHGVLAFKVQYENVPNFCFLVAASDMISKSVPRRLLINCRSRMGFGCAHLR